jgi:hypothetical protein
MAKHSIVAVTPARIRPLVPPSLRIIILPMSPDGHVYLTTPAEQLERTATGQVGMIGSTILEGYARL